MANSGPAINVGGEDIFSYRGLGDEAIAFVRKMLEETRYLQPEDARSIKIRGTFLIGISEDAGGVLVGFRPESPLNPNAQEPSSV